MRDTFVPHGCLNWFVTVFSSARMAGTRVPYGQGKLKTTLKLKLFFNGFLQILVTLYRTVII